MKRSRKILVACMSLALILATCVSGCGRADDREIVSQEQERFAEFLDEQFVENVQIDAITLHYTLAHPENYGITEEQITLGEYGEKAYAQQMQETQTVLTELGSFSYDGLTEEQQLCYDILKYALELTLEGEPYFLYEEVLSPTTGLQAQLPVLLAEYKFYDVQDVENYLKLLPCVEEYYADILEVEKLRSEEGLFLADQAVDDIISQCRDFIAEPEENFLITGFMSRLEGVEELNEDERLALAYENERLVKNHVIPAYENLIETLESLKGTGMNDKGLCYFPDGKAYYQWLVKNNTGSDWSISKMKTELEGTVQESIMRLQLAYQEEPDVLEQAETPSWPETEPEEILSHLKEAMLADYPAMEETSYSVKYVDPSLQDHLSPAFFLTPALDDWGGLAIYINESEENGNMDGLFTMLGHEGFPGHLYETVRFNQSDPAPIRQLLSFGGYSEGWATYAEYSVYDYAGFSENLANVLRYNDLAILAVCGRVDIGINYDGWDLEQTYEYLAGYGLARSVEDAENIYWSCIEEPANTLDYVIGYLEFAELRQEAEEQWQKDQKTEEQSEEDIEEHFPTVEYHAKLLDLGPAPFEILRKWME